MAVSQPFLTQRVVWQEMRVEMRHEMRVLAHDEATHLALQFFPLAVTKLVGHAPVVQGV